MDYNQWPLYQGYKSLVASKQEIRLLTVNPGNGTAPLVCSLACSSLNDQPNYCALSYYWGAPVPAYELKEILVDGFKVFIRPTLEAFLRNLTTTIGTTVVWLDALCINQRDASERGNQVALMGEIYKRAEKTYAWLGSGNADTDFACEYLGNRCSAGPLGVNTVRVYASQLFCQPYWRRLWVIQELVLSASIWLMVGNKIVGWKQLENVFNELYLLEDKDASEYRIKDDGAQHYNTICNAREEFATKRKCLLALMYQFRNHQCVDDRDKVYGLLALAERGVVNPDYSITVSELYFRLLAAYTPVCDVNLSKDYDIDIFDTVNIEKMIRRCVPLHSDQFEDCLIGPQQDVFSQFFLFMGEVTKFQPHVSSLVTSSFSSLDTRNYDVEIRRTYETGHEPIVSGTKLMSKTKGSQRYIFQNLRSQVLPPFDTELLLHFGEPFWIRNAVSEHVRVGDLAFRLGRTDSVLAEFFIFLRHGELIEVAVRPSFTPSDTQLIKQMLYSGVWLCKEGLQSHYTHAENHIMPISKYHTPLLLFHVDRHVLILFSLLDDIDKNRNHESVKRLQGYLSDYNQRIMHTRSNSSSSTPNHMLASRPCVCSGTKASADAGDYRFVESLLDYLVTNRVTLWSHLDQSAPVSISASPRSNSSSTKAPDYIRDYSFVKVRPNRFMY